ncbi:MAG: hypothetical protein LBV06_09680 [Propionibacteriaceae bacterium]|nr:hypothetical protein [Propionibacteriaceae bacterium]
MSQEVVRAAPPEVDHAVGVDTLIFDDPQTVAWRDNPSDGAGVDSGVRADPLSSRLTRVSLWRSGRAVWVLAGVGVLGLIIGYVLGGVVLSPQRAASPPPTEGLITAKVEARQITARVVGRADVAFTDRVSVTPPTPEDAVAAVVTGQVPTVGSQVNAGDVVLEVSGRPVFVLRGDFPSYRSLSAGSSGADVTELRAALNDLGLDAGPASASYDAALAEAVRALYGRAGYSAPDGGELATLKVRSAEDGVSDAATTLKRAKEDVVRAEKALDAAKADQATAQRNHDTPAGANQGAATDPGSADQRLGDDLRQAGDMVEHSESALQQAKDAVELARRGQTRAEQTLTDAQRDAWAIMPVGAVVFVPDLPRRVDEVHVGVGDDLAKLANRSETSQAAAPAPLVLSGAQIAITAQVGMDEAGLLRVDGPAMLTIPGGGTIHGVITSICDEAGTASTPGKTTGRDGAAAAPQRCAVAVTLGDLGGLAAADLVGNQQVTMDVGTSSTESLLVPVAAVSADTAGHARITVVSGGLEPGVAARDQKTTVVDVETGLSAEGMVEITRATPPITAGDLVVIGQGASQTNPTDPTSTPR